MIILSENNYRETGKAALDAGKLSLVALSVTQFVDSSMKLDFLHIIYLLVLSVFYIALGNLMIRVADKKANQRKLSEQRTVVIKKRKRK